MSHYLTFVFVPKGADVEKHVADALAPFCVNDGDNPDGWWDFYAIGGRWTGHLDGYDPEKDPRNIETCTVCGGSGKRRDMVVHDGCNGCAGNGRRVKWPTEWAPHRGDVQPASMVRDRKAPPYAVTLGGAAIVRDWRLDDKDEVANEKWKTAVEEAIAADALVAIVDVHC